MKSVFLCLASISMLGAHEIEWTSYKKDTLIHQFESGDWCSLKKAENMMDLIYQVKPELCVEVGVFTGSSIYPTAKALRYLGKGIVYAIDPWSKEECLQGYASDDPNYIWWNSIDLEHIYQRFLSLLAKYQLNAFCSPMRMTSLQAVNRFQDDSIDILHIDGNHTTDIALSDAQIWFPKVKEGGYIWFDDVNWQSTQKAVQFLRENCEVDETYSVENQCLLFKKNKKRDLS